MPPAAKTDPDVDAANFTLVDSEAATPKPVAKPRSRKPVDHGADAKSDRLKPDQRSKPKPADMPWKLIGILGGATALLLTVVVGGIILFGSANPVAPVVAAGKDAGNSGRDKQGKKIAANSDPEIDAVSGELPAALANDSIQRVKRSTVQLRVTSASGDVGEGSGFCAIERGLVVSNAHVLGMLHSMEKPRAIDVVINSGETDEAHFNAIVLGADRDHDLALLRLDAESNSMPLPPPLAVDAQSPLTELQKVYVFGFPYGKQLGKSITVAESSVSSIRKNKDGSLHQIQVNGGMHPGNSGGPVVDARGSVIGVSVSGIKGTLINFAVPGEKVKGMIQGRVLAANFAEPYKDLDSIRVPFKITCFDPMARIKGMKIDIWTAPAGGDRPGGTTKRPAAQVGDGPKKTVALNFLVNRAQGDVLLPSIPVGHAVWVQPILQNASGQLTWGHAFTLQNATGEPLERRPVSLALNLKTTPERTVAYSSKMILQMVAGNQKRDSHQKLDTELLEVVKATPDGDFEVRLSVGKATVNNVDKDKVTPFNAKAIDLFKKFAYGIVVTPDGQMKDLIIPSFGPPIDDETRIDVDELISHLTNSYVATSFDLPQRKVQPAETWTSNLYMLFGSGKAKQVAEVTFHCTYEGLRTKGDAKEAFIRFEGEVRLLEKTHDVLHAKIHGHALVDLARGYYSKIHYAVRSDIERGELLFSEIFEATMTRTPGNPRAIAAAPPATSGKSAKPPAEPKQPDGAEQPDTDAEKKGAENVAIRVRFGYDGAIEMEHETWRTRSRR